MSVGVLHWSGRPQLCAHCCPQRRSQRGNSRARVSCPHFQSQVLAVPAPRGERRAVPEPSLASGPDWVGPAPVVAAFPEGSGPSGGAWGRARVAMGLRRRSQFRYPSQFPPHWRAPRAQSPSHRWAAHSHPAVCREFHLQRCYGPWRGPMAFRAAVHRRPRRRHALFRPGSSGTRLRGVRRGLSRE